MKWSTLECASGAATDVPLLLERLIEDSQLRRLQAFEWLRGQLALDGRWFSASGPAVSSLIDVATRPGTDRHKALWLVSEVLTGGRARPFALLDSPTSSSSPAAPVVDAVNGAS